MNKLNAYMDHCWDGFYTCQERIQRFPALLEAEPGSVHNIKFTGTPAKHMLYSLRAQNPNAGTTVRMHYPEPSVREISVGGVKIAENRWDESTSQRRPIQQSQCGEWRWIALENILEFYVDAKDCMVEIKAKAAIRANVRLEWSFSEFFADGGTTRFVDRMAAALGIHASNIKTVSVYEGSLIINYIIINDSDD